MLPDAVVASAGPWGRYQATGRGFVIEHESMIKLFSSYLYSHFLPGFEMCALQLLPLYFQ
jgi:hypothetical protein